MAVWKPVAGVLLSLHVLAVALSVLPVCSHASRLHHVPQLTDRPFLSLQELDEFAELDEDSARNHFMNLIHSMDNGLDIDGEPAGGGGDGALSRGEVAIRLVRVEGERQNRDAQSHIDEIDTDEDDLLTWTELQAHPDDLGIPVVLLRAQRFAYADKDKDKFLTVHEVEAYFHPDTEPRMYKALAEEMMFMLDEDKNKLLDISEVTMSHIKRHWPDFADYAVDLEHLNALFTHLDDNNDRMLNATELRKFLKEHYDQRIEELVDAIFAVADDDKDNFLTTDELWRNHEQFIGSHHDRRHGSTPPHKVADALEARHHRDDHAHGHSHAAHADDKHDEL